MSRFVLLYAEPGDPPPADLERNRDSDRVVLLDWEVPRLLVIEAPVEVARELAAALARWRIGPETRWSKER